MTTKNQLSDELIQLGASPLITEAPEGQFEQHARIINAAYASKEHTELFLKRKNREITLKEYEKGFDDICDAFERRMTQ